MSRWCGLGWRVHVIFMFSFIKGFTTLLPWVCFLVEFDRIELLLAPPGSLLVWVDLQQNNKTSNCLFVLWEGGVEPIQSHHHRSQREANTCTHNVNLAPHGFIPALLFSRNDLLTCWISLVYWETNRFLSFIHFKGFEREQLDWQVNQSPEQN